MLKDYRDYIVNLRNNLIQCGVDVDIKPLEEYKEIYYEADKLGQILWFYSIMNISGADSAIPEFFIPLNGYYKEKMRKVFYQEFQEYLKEYKGLSKLALLSGESNLPIIGDVSVVSIEEIDENEEIDLFEGMNNEVAESESEEDEFIDEILSEVGTEYKDNSVVVHGTFLDDLSSSEENISFVAPVVFEEDNKELIEVNEIEEIHGTFLDDVSSFEEMLTHPEIAMYAEHGTFLDELEIDEYSRSFTSDSENYVDTSCISEIHGIYLDIEGVEESSNKAEVHGTFLEDCIEEMNTGMNSSDDEDVHGVFLDDIVSYEEEESDEPEIIYDENGFEIVEEEEPSYEYEEEYEDEYYEEPYAEDSNDWDSQYREEEPQESEGMTFNVNNGYTSQGANKTTAKGDRDLSDLLQDGVNSLLTKGKRFLVKETQKLRDME